MIDKYQENKLIETVFLYLNGERISLVQGVIVAISTELELDANKLYKSIKVTPYIEQKLFELLRVPANKQQTYQNKPHLLALLEHLNQDGYSSGHLAHLLHIIDNTTYNFYRKAKAVGLLALILSGFGIFTYFKPINIEDIFKYITTRLPSIILHWIERTFSLLKNLTFIGALCTTLRYFIFLYHTFYHGLSNLTQKLTAVFFRTIATSLNLGAYAIMFFSAGLATPLSGFLFISASAISVIESITHYLLIRYKPAEKDHTIKDPWLIQADLIREKNQHGSAIKTMLIRAFFAILVTALITAWCFIPASIPLTIAFMAAMVVCGWIESLTLSKFEERNAIKLQKSLQTASEQYQQSQQKDTSAIKTVSAESSLKEAPKPAVSKKPEIIEDTKVSQSHSLRFFKPASEDTKPQVEQDAALSLAKVC